MNLDEFIEKWGRTNQNERAAFQTYFNDLCDLIGHQPPIIADPEGEQFKFEKFVIKVKGGKGFADVLYRGKFIWEHKSEKENLEKAYKQALDYLQDAGNPPLIVVGDFKRIIIHTNYNNTEHTTYQIDLEKLGKNLHLIEYLFHEPEKLKPPDIKSNLVDKPRLSIGFRQVEPVQMRSGFGLFNLYGGQAGAVPEAIILKGHH